MSNDVAERGDLICLGPRITVKWKLENPTRNIDGIIEGVVDGIGFIARKRPRGKDRVVVIEEVQLILPVALDTLQRRLFIHRAERHGTPRLESHIRKHRVHRSEPIHNFIDRPPDGF